MSMAGFEGRVEIRFGCRWSMRRGTLEMRGSVVTKETENDDISSWLAL